MNSREVHDVEREGNEGLAMLVRDQLRKDRRKRKEIIIYTANFISEPAMEIPNRVRLARAVDVASQKELRLCIAVRAASRQTGRVIRKCSGWEW